MKSYLTLFCKWIPLIALMCATGPLCGCLPGWTVPASVEMYTRHPIVVGNHSPVMLIAPFENSEQSPDLGLAVARLFHEDIVRCGAISNPILLDDPDWLRRLHYRDFQAEAGALAQAQQRGADLLLTGSIPVYLPGHAQSTRVSIVAKLIAVDSGTILWWGKSTASGVPGRTILLWDMLLSPDPPDADSLTRKAVEKIVRTMFPAGAVQAASLPSPDSEGANAAPPVDAEIPGQPTFEPAMDEPAEPIVPPALPFTLPPTNALDQAYEEFLLLSSPPDGADNPAD